MTAFEPDGSAPAFEADSLTDPLTGLPSRRGLTETFARILAGARRHGRPVGIATLAIDQMETIRATYGPSAGNLVLAAAGVRLREIARASDFVGRLDAERFGVLLPETSLGGARAAAETLRAAIAEFDCGVPGGITASLGCAGFPPHGADAESLLDAAGAALAIARAGGANRVGMAGVLR